MHYSAIKKNDIANGSGIRTSLFVSGCRNNCKGCFNTETWDFKFGHEFTKETLNDILNSCKPDYISGLSILGGEPLEKENQEQVLKIILAFKSIYPNKDIWLFSGYEFDKEIQRWCEELPYTKEIVNNIDVLVDGKFILEFKDVSLGFRGSSNQRIIDVKTSLIHNEIVLHDKHNYKERGKLWSA